MKPKVIRPEIDLINKRFFQAIEILMKNNKLESLRAFCHGHDLTPAKYYEIRKSLDQKEKSTRYRLIDMDALSYLVNDYGISAEWLLTGKGSIFKE
jgi:hypothetical protein